MAPPPVCRLSSGCPSTSRPAALSLLVSRPSCAADLRGWLEKVDARDDVIDSAPALGFLALALALALALPLALALALALAHVPALRHLPYLVWRWEQHRPTGRSGGFRTMCDHAGEPPPAQSTPSSSTFNARAGEGGPSTVRLVA